MKFESILTGGRTFGKSWQRDQWMNTQRALTIKSEIYGTGKLYTVGRQFTNRLQAIEYTLQQHGIKTREIHGKLYAYDEHWDTIKQVHGGEWVNATAWTLQDVRDFLGY